MGIKLDEAIEKATLDMKATAGEGNINHHQLGYYLGKLTTLKAVKEGEYND